MPNKTARKGRWIAPPIRAGLIKWSATNITIVPQTKTIMALMILPAETKTKATIIKIKGTTKGIIAAKAVINPVRVGAGK